MPQYEVEIEVVDGGHLLVSINGEPIGEISPDKPREISNLIVYEGVSWEDIKSRMASKLAQKFEDSAELANLIELGVVEIDS